MKKRSLILSLLTLLLIFTVLYSCGAEHNTCTPAKNWTSDKQSHWHGCTGCEKKIDFNVHIAGAPVEENITEATPEKNGSKDIVTYCTVCNRELSRDFEIILYNSHTVCTAGEAVFENVIYPTCTESGSRDAVKYCTECKKELSRKAEIIPKAPHDFDGGSIEYDTDSHWRVCKTCGAEDALSKKNHYGGMATCSEKAICTQCNQSYGELKDHLFDQKITDNKFIKETGSCKIPAIYYKSCKCGEKSKSETFEGSLLAHDFVNGIFIEIGSSHAIKCRSCDAVSEATPCSVNNPDTDCTTSEKCICGRIITRAEEKHNFEGNLIITDEGHYKTCQNKSCTADGMKSAHAPSSEFKVAGDEHWQACATTGCSMKFNHGKHSFDKQNETQKYLCENVSCASMAKYYYSCECGEKGSESFSTGNPLPHNFTEGKLTQLGTGKHVAQCANCPAVSNAVICQKDDDGDCTTAVVCDCGRILTSAKSDHTSANEYFSDGEKHWNKCKICFTEYDFEYHIKGEANYENITSSTCFAVGSRDIVYYCKICNEEISRTTEEIKMTEHDFVHGSWIFTDTEHWKQCADCDATNERFYHTGGNASYTERAICEICGTPYGELLERMLISLSDYCIVYPENDNSRSNMLAANDLQRLIKEATGITLRICQDFYYAPTYGKMIAIGEVTSLNGIYTNIAPQLKLDAAALGNDGYIITKDDNFNIYLCGGASRGDRNAVYEFLGIYFDFEQFTIGNYHIDKYDSTYMLDLSVLDERLEVSPSIAYRSNGYNGISADAKGNFLDDAYRMRYANNYGVDMLMFVENGNWDSKLHNSLFWLPYDTYSSAHPKWYNNYNQFLFSESKRDLCYTAHGDETEYKAMLAACVAKTKQILAINYNSNKTILQFGKQDTTPNCTCSACNAMNSTYGSPSATVVNFMNDLMEAIENDSTITRKDFNMMFFAYDGFETAPVNMKLHDRINIMLAAAYSFNYQASINDSTNAKGTANLKQWGNVLGEGSLFLWTYSSKFNTFMYPTDTFAFYDENAYRFFAENKVKMFFNQSQGQQIGAVTCWSNLKMYLDAELAWDNTQTQAELIKRYMNGMFGIAADPMNKFFESVRAACQRDVLINDYAAQSNDQAYTLLGNKVILKKTKYWDKATIDSWLGYCEEAYAAIKVYESQDPQLYARLKRNIDTEWVSAAFMRIDLYGETEDVTVLRFEQTAIVELGMTQCRERYPDNISDLQEYINENWK